MEIPTSIYALFRSPLRSVLVSAVLSEALKLPNRSPALSDESVDSFLSRRFGESFACTFGSALVHGIYAADSRAISVRAAFPSLWDAEKRGWGSVIRGFLRPHTPQRGLQDYELGDVPRMMEDVAVYSFRDGMSTLSNALVEHLQRLPNVQIHTTDDLESIRLKDSDAFEVGESRALSASLSVSQVSSSSKILEPTHIVSAIPLHTLHTLLPSHLPLPHLLTNAASSVTVINMIFKAPSPFPEGFGYLIPRALNNTPTTILGTVFDSCALSEQDINSQFTKITVMVKGTTTPYPNVPDIIAQLSHHLASPLSSPLYTRVVRNENCIPVFSPGHLDRMNQLKSALQEGPWKGRLQVIGAGVSGVSVGDCVEAGKRAAGAW